MLACDFFVSVTVRFYILYVFVMMKVGSRRLVHFNVTLSRIPKLDAHSGVSPGEGRCQQKSGCRLRLQLRRS
jgi:hypothetical protein